MQMSQENSPCFVWYIIIKKPLYPVVVSHRVKFSTLTVFNRPYCSFQHHLDGLVGRRDLAVFVWESNVK